MDDSIGFQINHVARLLRQAFDARARQAGATRAQWHTLAVLARNEGCNQGMLADMMEVEPITIARMIDRLEEAGLVERRRDPTDRRAWRIHLAPGAQPLLEQLQVIGKGLSEDALAGIANADRAALERILSQIRINLSTIETKEAANG